LLEDGDESDVELAACAAAQLGTAWSVVFGTE
jgi:hypothetical protein